ncbi:hypothetical protein HDU77_004006 [Chytriomyces hyalinus]|nr:hypothetical protein HDU77_004006 [Chytriomyces hyalinus]
MNLSIALGMGMNMPYNLMPMSPAPLAFSQSPFNFLIPSTPTLASANPNVMGTSASASSVFFPPQHFATVNSSASSMKQPNTTLENSHLLEDFKFPDGNGVSMSISASATPRRPSIESNLSTVLFEMDDISFLSPHPGRLNTNGEAELHVPLLSSNSSSPEQLRRQSAPAKSSSPPLAIVPPASQKLDVEMQLVASSPAHFQPQQRGVSVPQSPLVRVPSSSFPSFPADATAVHITPLQATESPSLLHLFDSHQPQVMDTQDGSSVEKMDGLMNAKHNVTAIKLISSGSDWSGSHSPQVDYASSNSVSLNTSAIADPAHDSNMKASPGCSPIPHSIKEEAFTRDNENEELDNEDDNDTEWSPSAPEPVSCTSVHAKPPRRRAKGVKTGNGASDVLPFSPSSDKRPRDFFCEVCRNRFLRRQDLARHSVTHSKTKAHVCPLGCGTSFGRSDALTRHLKTKRCSGAV